MAGAVYAVACSTEFSTLLNQNIGSSALMGFSIGSYLLCGHKNWGIVAGAAFNLAGTLLGISLDMAHGNAPALAGGTLACIGLGLVIFGAAVREKHPGFGNKALKYGAYIAAFSNVFIAPEKFVAGHIREGVYYALLSAGDYFLSRSQNDAVQAIRPLGKLVL